MPSKDMLGTFYHPECNQDIRAPADMYCVIKGCIIMQPLLHTCTHVHTLYVHMYMCIYIHMLLHTFSYFATNLASVVFSVCCALQQCMYFLFIITCSFSCECLTFTQCLSRA